MWWAEEGKAKEEKLGKATKKGVKDFCDICALLTDQLISGAVHKSSSGTLGLKDKGKSNDKCERQVNSEY